MATANYRDAGTALVRRHRRLLSFLVVGMLNTAFGYSAFALLFVTTQHRNMSLVAATVLGILFNFFTTGRIVFGNRTWRTLGPFVLAYGVALGLNLAVLNLLVAVGVKTLQSQAISLPVVVVVSYFINARLVFRPTPTASSSEGPGTMTSHHEHE